MDEYVIVREGMVFCGWRHRETIWAANLTARPYRMQPAIYTLEEAKTAIDGLRTRSHVVDATIHQVWIGEDAVE